jgi:sporulation protein YlmC with PRC-barrel domain
VSVVAVASALAVLAQQTNQSNTNPNSTTTPAATTDTNQNVDTNRNTDANRTDANRNTSSKPGLAKLDDKTSDATVRASKLIGTNLKNSNDESVGEIKDLVLDATSGKVRYVAVTYGGFLGLGSKLFAVPFEAFRVRQNTSAVTPGDYALTLDVTKDQLKGAQGFDNDHWPDFADTRITQDLDRRYNVDRSQADRSQADRNPNRTR